jgi:Rrf2 family transcriptional regulator, nitric oxide-sensitive transcriptional repressor
MRLQISTRLALYAVLQLAADPRKQLAAEIADRFGVSLNHLSKVLRTLGRAGLVEAVRGAGGGYRFRGNARRVTLLDVILLFEDVASTGRGEDEPGAATDEGRALQRVLAEVGDIARATLSSITIATMLKLMQEPAVAQERAAPPAAGRRRSAGERA